MRFEIDKVLDELRAKGISLTRRDLIKFAAVGGAAVSTVSLLAACGGDDDEPETEATASGGGQPTATGAAEAASPTARSTAVGMVRTETAGSASPVASPTETGAAGQPGGTWTMALHGEPSMNIVTMPGALVDILVYKVMFNNLVQYELVDGAIEIVGDLAESWESNDDLTEYTFTLREGITWHDGTPFTVDDIIFTIETVLNPDNNAAQRANISTIDRVEAVDDRTFTFYLTQPFAAFPVMLGYNRVIFPKHLLEGADFANPADFIKNPVGTGPFKFKEQVQGSHVATEAYADYFGGTPLLDSIIFKVIPDGNNRAAGVGAGGVTFAVIAPPQLKAVEGKDNVEVRLAPQVNYYFFAINHSKPNLQDVRVRQAIAHAFDRQAIVDNILQGTGEPATGPINPLLGAYYNPDVTTYDVDLDRAAALLEEAGWTKDSDGKLANAAGDKFPILFNGPSNYPIMVQGITFAQPQLEQLGFEVTLDIVDWPVHLDKYHNLEYDLLMEWWITPPDPDLYAHYHSESQSNWWAYSKPQVDELTTSGRAEKDVEARIQIYHDLQAILADDVPVIYLYYPQEVQVVSKRSKGLPLIGYRDMLTWMEQAWIEE